MQWMCWRLVTSRACDGPDRLTEECWWRREYQSRCSENHQRHHRYARHPWLSYRILEKGGFQIKGWLSNKDLHDRNTETNEITVPQGQTEANVLGVSWNCKENVLKYKFEIEACLTDLTKCKILTQTARIYDLIGFVSAFLVRAKIKLQSYGKKELTGTMNFRWTFRRNGHLTSKKCSNWMLYRLKGVFAHGTYSSRQLCVYLQIPGVVPSGRVRILEAKVPQET